MTHVPISDKKNKENHMPKKEKKKTKTVKATWKYENIKIEFSEPHIQEDDNVLFVNNIEQILYYYYNLTVYSKNKDSNKWKKMWTAYAHDAPAIFAIPQMINDLMKDDFDSDVWQKQQFSSREGQVHVMSKSYDSFSLFNEDDYCLKRLVVFDENGNNESDEYRFFVGKSDDITSYISSGLLLRRLKKKDIIRLKKTAEEFIEKSIAVYNQNMEKYIKKNTKRFKTTENRTILFKYFTDEGKKHQIETVFIPGDMFSEINVLVKDKKVHKINFNQDIRSCNQLTIEDCIFKGFAKGKELTLILSGGRYFYMHQRGDIKGDFTVPLKMIYEAYIDVQEQHPEYLAYDEDMCYTEFSKLVKGDIKKIFETTNVSDLKKVWVSPIIDRFWMMRDEHGFKNPYKTAQNIISRIQKDCTNNSKTKKKA